jgi:hypothetical protein
LLLLGLASILQIVFLPGYLLLRVLKLRCDRVSTIVLSLALSQLLNHIMVVLLTAAGIYRSSTVYAIFFVEILLWIWFVRRSLNFRISDLISTLSHEMQPVADSVKQALRDRMAPIRILIWTLALFVLGGFLFDIIFGFQVFTTTVFVGTFENRDAVGTWNQWAIDWANNRFPERTYEYPQLMTSNWSLTYLFSRQTDVWIFAKLTNSTYCFGLMLVIINLSRKLNHLGYVLGVVVTYFVYLTIIGDYIFTAGLAELPVAFFAFTAVYCLILSRDMTDRKEQLSYIVMGAVIAAAAALTKQAGLYIAFMYPFLTCVLHSSFRSVFTRDKVRTLLLTGVIITLLVSPWYLYKQWEFHTDKDVSNVMNLLETTHEGRSPVERLAFAGNLIKNRMPWSLFPRSVGVGTVCLIMFFLIVALRNALQRNLVCLVGIPFAVIWAFCFSYDVRNVSLALPFLSVAVAVGIVESGISISEYLKRHQKVSLLFLSLTNRRVGIVLVLLVIGVATLSSYIPQDRFRSWHDKKLKRSLGFPEINQMLYNYNQSNRIEAPISTNYLMLKYLPELGQYYHSLDKERILDHDYAGYVLVIFPNDTSDELEERLTSGGFHLEFEGKSDYRQFNFYRKMEEYNVGRADTGLQSRH